MKKVLSVAGILGGMAVVLFFASLADYAFPGESARLMACWQGLDAMAVPHFPLMAVFAKVLGGGNVLAAICGAISVVAIFGLVSAFVAWRVRGEGEDVPKMRERLSLLAAVSAAVVFMLTPAVRSAATHLEPRMFDFTWALLMASLSVPFFRFKLPTALLALGLGAMAGFGLCDSVLFLLFLPLDVALLIAVARRRGKWGVAQIVLFGFVFFVVFKVACSLFGLSFDDFLGRASGELRAYRAVAGWVFVLLFATIPLLLSIFASARAFNERPGLPQRVFHATMTIAVVLSVATPLSPSALMAPYGILPVATSAFAAVVAGYLVAYWWLWRKSAFGVVMGSILAFVLLVSCVWNLFAFDGGKGAFADQVAAKIIDDLGDRRWFVSDGMLDNHLRLVAAKKGVPLHVISLSRDLDPDYLRALGEELKEANVGGSKNAELRLSLNLGVLPFLQDWFAADPSVVKDVAIFGAPDLWHSAGLTPVPEFLFFGADETRCKEWDAWHEFDGILHAPKGWGSYRDRKVTDPLDRLRLSLRRHVGLVANNRGVYLLDRQRDDEAWKMFELVLDEIDHDNICAVFNEVGMLGEKHPSAVAKRRDLERMIKAAVDDSSRRYLLWRLGSYYGYVRNPDMFVRLGHVWARSGRPGDALAQIRRAIDFVPDGKRASLMNMMAALYANENEQRKSRVIYENVLTKDGGNHDALLGLMRLEMLEGNEAKARDYLQRAAAVAGSGPRAKIESAMAAMMDNDLTTARTLLKAVTDADKKNMQAWSLLSAVTIQQIDAAKDEKTKGALEKELEHEILPMMEKQASDAHDYYLQATKGFLLIRKGEKERQKARDAFLEAAKARPDIVAAQDIVLRLDMSLADKDGAESHARDVLRRNRKAPLANYVMGSIALGKGQMEEAEAYLRRAADAPQPVPLALNDLAEVLRRKLQFDEAERYARKAVKAAPKLYIAWETLGSVLMDAGRSLDEAEASIRKACDLSKEDGGREADVRMLVSLARVQILRGERERAKITLGKVNARIGELSAFEREEFEKVKKGFK